MHFNSLLTRVHFNCHPSWDRGAWPLTDAPVTSRLKCVHVLNLLACSLAAMQHTLGLILKISWKLQLVQNAIGVNKKLHWLKVLVLTYKAINRLGPGHLNDRLCWYQFARTLLSAGGGGAASEKAWLVSTWGRAFSVVAMELSAP